MLKTTGPFLFAESFIDDTTEGANDAEKTDTVYRTLLAEISAAGSGAADVIAVHRFQTEQFDGAATRDVYVKYFKPIMPLNTAVTVHSLKREHARCRIAVTAVAGSSTAKEWNGIPLARTNYASGSPLESVLGYSRMVKTGPFVFIGGTTSVLPDGSVAGSGNSTEQDLFIWNKLIMFLKKAGGAEPDIIKVKKYVTPAYKPSGVGMPDEGSLHPYTVTVPIARLNRPAQLEEVELAAVIAANVAAHQYTIQDSLSEYA